MINPNRLIPEEHQVDADHAPPGKYRRFLRALLIAAAVALFAGSLPSFISFVSNVTPAALRPLSGPLGTLAILLGACAVIPELAALAGILIFASYLFAYGFYSHAALTLCYAGCIGAGSWLLSGRMFKEIAERYSGKYSVRMLIAGLTFIGITFAHAFILLALKQFHVPVVLFTAAVFALSCALLERRRLREDWQYAFNTLRTAALPRPKAESILSACIVLLILFCGVVYLQPGAILGDADKGYLAMPKFFARGNTLFLNEPVYMRDAMRLFPHFQEHYLALGYLLSGNLGAKFLAWLLVCVKCFAMYQVGVLTFRLSGTQARLAVLCHALLPMMVEMQTVERPDNLLAICVLGIVFFLESAVRSKEHGERASFNSAIAAIIVLACAAVSIKYTAAFVFVAAALAYWRVCFGAARSLWQILCSYWAVLLPAIGVGLFWYVRNLLDTGELVALTLFGKYHLTISFPPLRTLAEIWQFLTQGLLATAGYTEFSNFGYGIFGLLIWPGLLLALLKRGPERRTAALVLIYCVLLLNSSRQIRYLAAVSPLMIILVISVFGRLELSEQRAKITGWREAWITIFVGLQAAIALAVAYDLSTGQAFRRQWALPDMDLSKGSPYFAPINRRVAYPEVIATSAYDGNYNIDAQLVRIDPLWNLAELQARIKEFAPKYFLLPSPGTAAMTFPFFNDLEFFECIAKPEVYTGHLHLLKADPKRLAALIAYVEKQGWELEQTVIVSEAQRARFPSDYFLGDEIKLPGLPHRLYRLASMWWGHGGLKRFPDTETFHWGKNLGWFFEDAPADSWIGQQNLMPEIVHSGVEFQNVGWWSVFTPPEGTVGKISYRIALPENVRQSEVELYVYGRIRVGTKPMVLNTAGKEIRLPQQDWMNQWRLLHQSLEDFTGKPALNLDFVLPEPLSALRDIRVLLRKPDTKRTKLFVPEAMLTAGKLQLNPAGPVFSLAEDFSTSIRVSPGLKYKTTRENVRAVEESGGAMAVTDSKQAGVKVYQLSVPQELGEQAAIKVFMNATGDAEVAVRQRQKATRFRATQTPAHLPNLIGEQRIKSGEIEIEVRLRGDASVWDFVILLGQAQP